MTRIVVALAVVAALCAAAFGTVLATANSLMSSSGVFGGQQPSTEVDVEKSERIAQLGSVFGLAAGPFVAAAVVAVAAILVVLAVRWELRRAPAP